MYEEENGTKIKYYVFNGMTVAVKRGNSLYYLHGDHLSSTSLTTNTGGGQTASRAYYAYGSTRSSSGTLQTDRTFTGQKQDGTGLLYYNARYYDPSLGTFLSPDTLVPDPGAVIDYNRYLYARGNPVKYADPSGHFSEEQLTQWFGDDWESFLGEKWSGIFREAVFGDAVFYGNSGHEPELAVFVEHNGSLAAWSVSERRLVDISSIVTERHNGGLYRSQNRIFPGRFNFWQGAAGGNMLNPQGALYNRSNHYQKVAGYSFGDVPDSWILPLDWYMGSEQHVVVRDHLVGFDIGFEHLIEGGALAWDIAKKGPKGTIGPGAALLLAVDLLSDIQFETRYYVVASGSGAPPVLPAPTPPRSP